MVVYMTLGDISNDLPNQIEATQVRVPDWNPPSAARFPHHGTTTVCTADGALVPHGFTACTKMR